MIRCFNLHFRIAAKFICAVLFAYTPSTGKSDSWFSSSEMMTPRMSLAEVQSEYRMFQKQYPDDKTPLDEFAAQMDLADGADKRFEIYRSKPGIYPVMPIAWVESEYRRFKHGEKDSKLSISEFAWQADCSEGGFRHLAAYKNNYSKVAILYDFMGNEELPIPDVFVIEKRAGYIKLIMRTGQTITHSGRYSLMD